MTTPRTSTATLLTATVCIISVLCLCLLNGANGARNSAAASHALRPGPWGQISTTSLTIAPPLHLVPHIQPGGNSSRWVFANTTRQQLAELLSHAGIDDGPFQRLIAAVRHEPSIDGFVLDVEPDILLGLGPQARAAIYHRLCGDIRNLAQMNAFRYFGPSAQDWFSHSGLSQQTRQRVEPLVYRHGQMLFFADLIAVLPQIDDAQQRLQLVQCLAAESTLSLTLHVDQGQDIEPLVQYWGRGRRAKDVRVLLSSLARQPGGADIDIMHLLPPFPRARLYTYPDTQSLLDDGDSRDCHWTALNFFSDQPSDHYADALHVADVLRQQYEPVTAPLLGDLVLFSSDGELYHSAVYIADDILFTRNGTRLSRPWMLLPLAVVRDFYPKEQPPQITFMRQRGLEQGFDPAERSAGRNGAPLFEGSL